MVSLSAHLICSSCGSENWMFVSAPILAHLREYDEQKTQQRTAVAQHIAQLEREGSSTPNPAPL
jgi:hypothetical protein